MFYKITCYKRSPFNTGTKQIIFWWFGKEKITN